MVDQYWVCNMKIDPIDPTFTYRYRRDHIKTHWGWVTHICVGNLTIIGSDNGLSPGRRQAIVWINAEILLIGPVGTNFSEILIGIHKFSFTKMHLKMTSAKWRPFSLGLNVLTLRLQIYLNLCWEIPRGLIFKVLRSNEAIHFSFLRFDEVVASILNNGSY